MGQIDMSAPTLEIRNLSVNYRTEQGPLQALRNINLQIPAGRIVGIVGESGCGKSTLIASIIRLLAPNAEITQGSIRLKGNDLLDLDSEAMRALRGDEISMVFQDPMTSLNPVLTIGSQMINVQHRDKQPKSEKRARAVRLLERVGIPDPAVQLDRYPHHLSGGMRQRVVIAMALICRPALLIADEPTTALDVTIQAQILELIKDLQQEMGMSVILITHDLGVIAETSDNVAVMYAGRMAESGTVYDIFDDPRHPYTHGLLASIPRLDHPSKTKLTTIEGMVPGLLDLPQGCRFENRCPYRMERCVSQSPAIETVTGIHKLSCFNPQSQSSPDTAMSR